MNLLQTLMDAVAHLNQAGVTGELWVDGSFLTEAQDPQDIDVVLRIKADLYDKGNGDQKSAVDWFQDELPKAHNIDGYVLVEYPEGHPQYWAGETWYAYWMRQWSFSRGDEIKGIAVIMIS